MRLFFHISKASKQKQTTIFLFLKNWNKNLNNNIKEISYGHSSSKFFINKQIISRLSKTIFH